MRSARRLRAQAKSALGSRPGSRKAERPPAGQGRSQGGRTSAAPRLRAQTKSALGFRPGSRKAERPPAGQAVAKADGRPPPGA